jgi:3-oxoacyl-(acyl-carrier-protein) synthase
MGPDGGRAAILGLGLAQPAPAASLLPLPQEVGLGPVFAHLCPAILGKGIIPAGVLRKLGRAQKLALLAASEALQTHPLAPPDQEQAALCLGTGFGELGETLLFLTNLIRRREQEPMPTRFTNAVHNSLASQVAILFSLKGENHTFTQGPVSFELALWQALRLLAAGRARRVLALGVDDLQPFLAYAGVRFGFWKVAETPEKQGSAGFAEPLPGEGAAAFVLARESESPGPAGRPLISGVRVQPAAVGPDQTPDRQGELAFLLGFFKDNGLTPADLDLVFPGAASWPQFHAWYQPVLEDLGTRRGRPLAAAFYKQHCGEFCTASALGLALAVKLLKGDDCPPGLPLWGELPAPPRQILLYQTSPLGFRSACLVGI